MVLFPDSSLWDRIALGLALSCQCFLILLFGMESQALGLALSCQCFLILLFGMESQALGLALTYS